MYKRQQFIFKGKLFEGKHEPIISKELFYAVQEILDGRTNRKARKYEYLFQGLAKDASGGQLRCSNSKNIAYYNAANGQKLNGGGKYLPESVLDAAVSRWFAKVSITKAGIEEFRKGMDAYLAMFEHQRRDAEFAAQKQLAICSERARKARMKLLDEVITDTEYREIADAIEAERQAILQKIPREQAVHLKDLEPIVQVLKTLKNLSKIFPRLPTREKATFAKMFLLELKITEGDIIIKGKKEIEALLDFPKKQTGWLGWDDFRKLTLQPLAKIAHADLPEFYRCNKLES